mgnify:CR=1 FL=1
MGDRILNIYNALSDEEKNNDKDYDRLLAILMSFLDGEADEDAEYDFIGDVALERARIAFEKAVGGLGIDMDYALQLLEAVDDNTLTKLDKNRRDGLINALSNIIEFAVCEEYQAYEEMREAYPDIAKKKITDSRVIAILTAIYSRYNHSYRLVEDNDVHYTMSVFDKWIRIDDDTYITYWTQGDARVRPWHRDLEGFTERKSRFPEWMIPPIEFNCRCYLEESEVIAKVSDIKMVSAKIPAKPSELNDVYSESICKGGRIFSKSHPYFDVAEKDVSRLSEIVEHIKKSYNAK